MEKYFLKPHLAVEITDSYINIIGDKVYKISPASNTLKEFFEKLQIGLSVEEAGGSLTKTNFNKIYSLLHKYAFLTQYKNTYKETFVEKQFDYFISTSEHPLECQKNLENSTVLILGCGGIGHIVVQHLLAAGVKSFVLIDGDRVEKSNFNRQFCFEEKDIGKYKTQALANYIYNRNQLATIDCHTVYLDCHEAFQSIPLHSADLFVCAADEPKFKLQELVVSNCMKYDLPAAFAGVGLHMGFVGPILKSTTDYINYLDFINKHEKKSTAAKPLIPSISYTNTLVGAFLSREILHFLSGHLECTIIGKVHLLDLNQMSIISSESI